MKRWMSLCYVMAVLIGTFGGVATAQELPVDVAFDFTYSSAYYWRGAAGGAGSFAMPSLDVSYAADPVTVGVNLWVAQGMEPEEGADSEAVPADNSEIDYTLYASLDLEPLALDLAVVDYVIPIDAPLAQDKSTVEVQAAVSLTTLPIDNSLLFAWNLAGDDDKSWYLEPSLGYTIGDLSVGLAVGVGSQGAYYSGTQEGTTVINVLPSVSYSIPLSEDNAVDVGLGVGFNPKTKFKMPFFTIGSGFDW